MCGLPQVRSPETHWDQGLHANSVEWVPFFVNFASAQEELEVSPLGIRDLGARTRSRVSTRTNRSEIPYEGRWRLTLGGASIFDELDRAQYATVGFEGGLTVKLDPRFEVKTNLILPMRAGQFQTRFNENFAANQVILANAYADWQPLSRFHFQFGVINQGSLDQTGTVVKFTGFPGFRQSYSFSNSPCSTSISLFQGIPTSVSLETERAEQEAIPEFYTATLSSCVSTSFLTVIGDASYFEYRNLPAIVANRSGLIGNIVFNQNTPFASFANGFSGPIVQIQSQWRVAENLAFQLGGSYINNLEAIDGLNEAASWLVGLEIGNTIVFRPSFQQIFREPNVSPAFYTARVGGYTNRQIQRLNFDLEFVNRGYRIRAAIIDGQIITPVNPIESNQREVVIGLETAYGTF